MPTGSVRIRAAEMPASVFPRVDKEADDSLFAERLGGFQPMQALDKHETSTVRPYQDRRLQALVEHARGDSVYAP